MRLINVNTWEVEDHPSHVTPPYAILSHTWGSEEVTLRDMEVGDWLTRRDKREGREKIRGCCAAASTEGYKYVWVDTCCIDKTSSAELSEAINSMFRWYHESAICFAYLSDVDSAQDPTQEGSDFAQSRWFTRGWTLQELLAPKEIVFVGRDWGEIGTKGTLQRTISSATRITEAALTDRELAKYSVAQKMSWAAGRQTTRLEDEAYCLVGLFDVNMPLLYGEGQRAFFRLQEEIMKRTDDESIFAWTHPPEEQTHVRMTGLLAWSPNDFRDSSNVFIKPRGWRERYVNPFEMVRQHVRIRLPVLGPLRGIELRPTEAQPGLLNIVNAERSGERGDDDDGPQSGLLGHIERSERHRLKSPDLQEDLLGSKRRKMDDGTWVAGLAAPRLRLDPFDGSSSVELATETDENDPANAKLVRDGSKDDKSKTTWQWYIYAPVMVIPLKCSVVGKQLGILLTRGSCRSKDENILYRLHSPSLVCIEDVFDIIHLGTPLSSIYAYASARYAHSEVALLQQVSLEIRMTNVIDKGYQMFAEQGGDWAFQAHNKKLVKFQDRQQARNSMALFLHRSHNAQSYPSFFLVMDLKEPYIGILSGSQIPGLGQHVWRVVWGGQSRAEIFLGGTPEQYLVLKVRNLEKAKYLSLSLENQESHLPRAKIMPVHHGLGGLNLRLQRVFSLAMPEEDKDDLDVHPADPAMSDGNKLPTSQDCVPEQPIALPQAGIVV